MFQVPTRNWAQRQTVTGEVLGPTSGLPMWTSDEVLQENQLRDNAQYSLKGRPRMSEGSDRVITIRPFREQTFVPLHSDNRGPVANDYAWGGSQVTRTAADDYSEPSSSLTYPL